MLMIDRSDKTLSSQAAKTKVRFGGPVRLYSDPLYAFRARGAVISPPRSDIAGSRTWSVLCPVHDDIKASATLTKRNDSKWKFSCYYCDNRPVKKKLKMLSKVLSIVMSDLYAGGLKRGILTWKVEQKKSSVNIETTMSSKSLDDTLKAIWDEHIRGKTYVGIEFDAELSESEKVLLRKWHR